MLRARTNFHFKDGGISSRVVDFDNQNQVTKFLLHAADVIRSGGKVVIKAEDEPRRLSNRLGDSHE